MKKNEWLILGGLALLFLLTQKSVIVIPDDEPLNMRVLRRYR